MPDGHSRRALERTLTHPEAQVHQARPVIDRVPGPCSPNLPPGWATAARLHTFVTCSAYPRPRGRAPIVSSPGQLAVMIAAKLASCALPAHNPVALDTSMGTGEPCAACELPIDPADVQCICDVPFHETLQLHVHCLTEWRRQLS